MSGDTPIACNLDALSAEERRQRAALADRLRGGTLRVQETTRGYRLHLNADPALYRDAVDFISLERRCCPFLELKLVFAEEEGPVYFDIGSGTEVKAFLAASGVLGCAGQR